MSLTHWSKCLAVALIALAAAACGFATAAEEAADEKECGEFGTSVLFAESPAEAAKFALEEEKLLFILHVSGLFEEADFT
jgi:hypothetical protein